MNVKQRIRFRYQNEKTAIYKFGEGTIYEKAFIISDLPYNFGCNFFRMRKRKCRLKQ